MSTSSIASTKNRRASLCASGPSVNRSRCRRAFARALAHAFGVSVYVVPSIRISTGSAGTCCSPVTVFASTAASLASPLIRAASGRSVPVASTPGNSEPTVASTTSFSPSDGST